MLKCTLIKQLLVIYEHELFDYCLTDNFIVSALSDFNLKCLFYSQLNVKT